MAKNVFRPYEIKNLNAKVRIAPPTKAFEPVQEIEEVDVYAGPTAEDLRREAEVFKANWEQEKAQMIANAQAEADKIIKDAEQLAFEELKKKNTESTAIKNEAVAEAEKLAKEAEEKVAALVAEAEKKSKEIEMAAYDKGFEKGKEEGFKVGESESERLVDRLHLILSKAIDARKDIIDQTETQLIQLVLQIAKKVIKVLSENQKNIVINNIIQSLRKLKSRADVMIKVNLEDLKLTTENTKNIIKLIENVDNVTVMEDTTVDRGGCIIETDFGQIDARISSQLREIEERILELVPIKTKQTS